MLARNHVSSEFLWNHLTFHVILSGESHNGRFITVSLKERAKNLPFQQTNLGEWNLQGLDSRLFSDPPVINMTSRVGRPWVGGLLTFSNGARDRQIVQEMERYGRRVSI